MSKFSLGLRKSTTSWLKSTPHRLRWNRSKPTLSRCPDPEVAEKMIEHIEEIRKEGNSIGGVIGCVARDCPAGWGEPVFDKLEADLAKAVMSLPACKGFEVGSGFAGTDLTGLEHNDEFYADDTKSVFTKSNRSGGIQGGISNGQPVLSTRPSNPRQRF